MSFIEYLQKNGGNYIVGDISVIILNDQNKCRIEFYYLKNVSKKTPPVYIISINKNQEENYGCEMDHWKCYLIYLIAIHKVTNPYDVTTCQNIVRNLLRRHKNARNNQTNHTCSIRL